MINDRSDAILPQDLQQDENGQMPNFALPLSQAEIEDLLYNADIPAAERLQQLQVLRADVASWEADDRGEDDPRALLGEIDLAIQQLSGDLDPDNEAYPGLDMTQARDPADHMETLSPDDDLRLGAEGDEAEALDEDDPAIAEWDPENEGHDGRMGRH